MKRAVRVLLVGLLLFVALAVVAQAAPGDHQDWEPRPIPSGVSGGNVKHRSQIDCSNGTLGASVSAGGRTTGRTTGQVSTVNVLVTVDYCVVGNPCGQCILERPAPFSGQIAITPGTFTSGGDSESSIVQNVSTAPCPVALLFAGSLDSTIGSPIGPVLAAFGTTLVGMASATSDEASSAGGATVSEQELAAATAIQERHQEALMRIPGVVGVGIGRLDRTGVLVLRVYLEHETPELQQRVPEVLEGLAVEKVVTGPFQAQ